MAVQASDILFYLTGGASNTDPNQSQGGARSNTQIGSGLNNLYDNITGTNHAAGNADTSQQFDYRVFCVKLASPLADASSSTLNNAKLQIASQSLGDCNIQAYVSTAVNTQITAGANENTAPTQSGAITFQTIPGGGLALPTSISPGDEVHIAIKRGISAGSTAAQNSVTFQITGDTI